MLLCTTAPNLLTVIASHPVSISSSLLLFPGVSEPGRGWIHWIRVNSGSPGREASDSLYSFCWFTLWPFLPNRAERWGTGTERDSCRLPGAVWLQLSLAISECASRWQAWSALLALLGRGELCYLEQGNNPLFNFNILKVHSIYVTHLQGASVCSCKALPPPTVMIRTRYSSAVWW